MARQRVFLTGATGSMGRAGMEQLLLDADRQDLVILALPDEASRELLAGYAGREGLEIVWGDLTDYPTVLGCVRGADIVLHVGALVSPEADNHPQRTMEVNYGSTMNILTAIARVRAGPDHPPGLHRHRGPDRRPDATDPLGPGG